MAEIARRAPQLETKGLLLISALMIGTLAVISLANTYSAQVGQSQAEASQMDLAINEEAAFGDPGKIPTDPDEVKCQQIFRALYNWNLVTNKAYSDGSIIQGLPGVIKGGLVEDYGIKLYGHQKQVGEWVDILANFCGDYGYRVNSAGKGFDINSRMGLGK
jgi:hypothetical protein